MVADFPEVGNMFNLFKKTKDHGEDIYLCPVCKVNMNKLQREEIIIDKCPKCEGIWLDHGELDKLSELSKKYINEQKLKEK